MHQAELRAWVLETVLPQAEGLMQGLVVCLAGEVRACAAGCGWVGWFVRLVIGM